MKRSLLVTCLCFVVKLAFAQSAPVYEVPIAAQQPAWVFPVWFSSADGQADTIYLCYDPGSGVGNDSLFGMYPLDIDRSAFNACVSSCEWPLSVFIRQFPEYSVTAILENAVYPVTIRFDVRMLFSDSLNIVSAPGRPKAQVVLLVDGVVEGCPGSSMYTYVKIGPEEYFDDEFDGNSDSIIVLNSGSFLAFVLGVSPYVPIPPVDAHEECDVSSVIVFDDCRTKAKSTEHGEFRVYDALGHMLQRGTFAHPEPIVLNAMNRHSPGMLIMETFNSQSRCVTKIISR